MKSLRIPIVLLMTCTLTFAQPKRPKEEPLLGSVALPRYPVIARNARVQGSVELHFTIDAEGAVVDVQAVSGHPMLRPAAIENVKTWKFITSPNVAKNWKTRFEFRLTDREITSDEDERPTVTFESFHRVVITTDPPEVMVIESR